jgi:type III pantothenate kinase
MLLTIDIGNTNTTVGLFDGERLIDCWNVRTDTHRTADEYRVALDALLAGAGIPAQQAEGACIASVVPQLTATWQTLCERCCSSPVLVVGAETLLGIALCYDNPRELGIDRALAAAAAYKKFNTDLVVIDFGTATTMDYVSSRGLFLGGSIMPGLKTAAEALFEKTRQLPRIEYELPESMLGTNTVACLQIGILGGYCLMVEAMVARIRQQVQGAARVVATGGLAPLIARHTNVIDTVEEHLLLDGLKLAYELNR